MDDKQFQQLKDEMKSHTADTIERVVNGKIDKLSHKLDDYIVDDTAWKERAEPAIKAFENTSWLWRLFVAILKVLGLVSVGLGGWAALKQFLSK